MCSEMELGFYRRGGNTWELVCVGINVKHLTYLTKETFSYMTTAAQKDSPQTSLQALKHFKAFL